MTQIGAATFIFWFRFYFFLCVNAFFHCIIFKWVNWILFDIIVFVINFFVVIFSRNERFYSFSGHLSLSFGLYYVFLVFFNKLFVFSIFFFFQWTVIFSWLKVYSDNIVPILFGFIFLLTIRFMRNFYYYVLIIFTFNLLFVFWLALISFHINIFNCIFRKYGFTYTYFGGKGLRTFIDIFFGF